MSEKKIDIGHRIKARAKQFDSKNGKVTYTLKELLKAVHEDIADLSNDIKTVNTKLNGFMVNEVEEITEIRTSVKLYKRLTIAMMIGLITIAIGQITIL